MMKSEMGYRLNDDIEICSSEQNEPGSYYPGTVLAVNGRNQYLVMYKTRLEESGRPLARVVGENEIRPEPPDTGKWRMLESDVVDGYVNGVWRIGKIVKKLEPNYHVELDDGSEFRLTWFNVRIHLDFVDGKWVCRKHAYHKLDDTVNEAKPIQAASKAESDTVESSEKFQELEKHFVRAVADNVNLLGSIVEDLFQATKVLPSTQGFGSFIFSLWTYECLRLRKEYKNREM